MSNAPCLPAKARGDGYPAPPSRPPVCFWDSSLSRPGEILKMSAPKKCPDCDTAHHPWQAHVFLVNSAKKKLDALVVDSVVVDRNKDRHRKTPERREYLRIKQRESRARRKVA